MTGLEEERRQLLERERRQDEEFQQVQERLEYVRRLVQEKQEERDNWRLMQNMRLRLDEEENEP